MAEVVRLVPSTAPPSPATALVPNAALVEGLENLLGLAREGTLTSMAAALVFHEGSTDSCFDISADDNSVLLAGAGAYLGVDGD